MLSCPRCRSSTSLPPPKVHPLLSLLLFGSNLTLRLDSGYSILSFNWAHAKGTGSSTLTALPSALRRPPGHGVAEQRRAPGTRWCFWPIQARSSSTSAGNRAAAAVAFPPFLQAFILWIKKRLWKGSSRGGGIAARASGSVPRPSRRGPCAAPSPPAPAAPRAGFLHRTPPRAGVSTPKTEQPPRTGRAGGGIAAGRSASGFAWDRRRFRVTPCPRPRRDFLLLSSSFVSAHLCAFPLQKLVRGGGRT